MPAALLILALVAAPAEKRKIAVIDLADRGAGPQVAQNLTDVLAVALNQLGVFDVLSRSEIQQMVAFEQQKQLLGCESDTSCLVELGGALGVALLVTGSAGKVGASYILNLALTDTSRAQVLAREQREIRDANQLTKETQGAARFLVRSLLAREQGFLVVKTSEAGADVEIDGHIVGTTPLPRQTLPGGPHTIRLAKKSFVTWARDIELKKDDVAVLEAQLVPSIEFIEDYDERAGRWRLWSYLSGGVGLAGLLFGGYGYFVYNAGRADAFNREVIAAGCDTTAVSAPDTDCAARFADRRDRIARFDLISLVSGWVGVAALGAGVYLFTQGPEPGIYDQYKPESAGQLSIAPLDGGAAVFATFSY